MSLEIINHDLDENAKEASIQPETLPGKDYSEVLQIKKTQSVFRESSSTSIDNRVDPSRPTTPSEDILSEYRYIKEFKKLADNNELYEGEVLLNNLHGHGFFLTQKNGQKIFYDGLFYVNKLEGYSQIFYEDNTYFQGLFKQHKRYGPGVVTYPNGSKDVGFWDGFSLVRLASVVGSETVPRLATTVSGRTKLLCYKYLIPLCDRNDDIPKSIFNDIGTYDEVLKYSNDALNWTIRNVNSLFFHKKFFDHHFFGGKDCTIKVAIEDNDSSLPSEGDESSVSEEDFCKKVEKIKSKIKEMDEKLQPYRSIRENIQERINYCRQCCTVKDSIQSSYFTENSSATIIKQESPIRPEGINNKHISEDVITLDLKSLMQGDSVYDPSLLSVNIQEIHIEKSLQEMSIASSKQNIIEFCTCGEMQEVDDMQHLEDQLSNIIKQETFYTNIRDNLQKRVNSMIETEEKKLQFLEPRFKLVEVTELWAWNNEELMMEMQKHCFKHRNSEEMVNFSVQNLILGNRKEFGQTGPYEDICHNFLISCSKGRKDFVRRCLREKINPNLSDARGNSGIFFAVAKDQIEIIPILTNFGAKLDQINDDELTPLSLCILKYISQKYGCENWEKAFLPETQICSIPNLPKWYHMHSLISQSSSSIQSESMDKESSQNDISNSRIIELFRRLSNLHLKSSSFIRNVPNTSYVLDLSYKDSGFFDNPIEIQHNEDLQIQLRATHLTMMTLLDYGADPSIAKVPYPPLVLSLFSESPDMVTQLLQAHADPNILVTDDNLSCLHIICSLVCTDNTIEMCRLLLLFKCDPNLKTLPAHWEDRKLNLIGNIPEEFSFEDNGKNPLHLLCMRKDFEMDSCDNWGTMCKLLIKGGVNYKETYLGHTPLSLAVLVGNVRLAKHLIRTSRFDPHQNLEYHMGNILTLFTLKRFENILPTDKCKAMLTALSEIGVNVLRKVEDSENAVAFAEEGDFLFNIMFDKEEKKGVKGKAKLASTQKKSDKHSQCAVITEFLKDLGRDTIIKRIQMIATEILYDLAEENILEKVDISIPLAEFLAPHIALENLEALFHLKKIDPHRLSHDYIKNLLNFVDLHKKMVKVKKAVAASKASKGKKGEDNEDTSEESIEHLILTANFKKSAVVLPPHQNFIVKPGFDDPEIYNVCFHCLKGEGKELKICPRCELIRFCSSQCNKLNLKVKTPHTCNIIFYDMSEEQLQDFTHDVSLPLLANKTKENCQFRLFKNRESKLIQEEQKLLEMWRADKFGTKFLKFKPLLQQTSKTRRSTNVSVNLYGLKNLLERNFHKNPADFDSYSIEALLNRLSSRHKIQEGNKSARSSLGHWLGSKVGSRVGSVFSEFLTNELLKEDKPKCTCEKPKHVRQKRKSVRQKRQEPGSSKQETLKGQNVNDLASSQFEDFYNHISVRKTRSPVTRMLKKIPSKYQKFIEIMGTYFPEVDMSFWLLPYACCSNGQLFYKFCENDIFRESYSLT